MPLFQPVNLERNLMRFRLVEIAHCKQCQYEIRLPPEMLEGTIEHQIGLLKDAPPVAVSCMKCKHVYSYQGHDWVDGTIVAVDDSFAHPVSLTAFLMKIQCDDKSCRFPLTVIAVRALGTTDEDALAELPTWTVHDLKCQKEHPISKAETA